MSMEKRLTLIISLILLTSLSAASYIPFDGMTLEYQTDYEFENEQYPSANSQETDDIVLSFSKSGDTYEVETVGSGSSMDLEGEYGADLSTTFWIPHNLKVGENVEITGFEYGVSTLSRTIELEDFGEVKTVELRYSNSSEETTVGDMEVTNYRGTEKRYYHAETGLLLKIVEENSYTHTTSFGEMDKKETSTIEIQENNVDTDDDGLTDLQELIEYNTDPTMEDTDQDGLSDRAEVQDYNTDPTEADTDSDNLTDEEEVNLGTDPTDKDTDSDGLFDGREKELGTDPKEADSDSDGVEDQREIELGSNPNRADTDQDNLDDGREVELETNLTKKDTDEDGLQDGREVQIGTFPLQADTDDDFWNDSIDPMPVNPLVPNGLIALAIVVVGGAIYKRRAEKE